MWGKNGLLCLCNVYVFFISATMMCWLVWVDLLTILGEQEWMVWRQSRLYNCNCCLTGPIVSSSYIKLLPIPITCQIWFRVRPLPMYIPNGFIWDDQKHMKTHLPRTLLGDSQFIKYSGFTSNTQFTATCCDNFCRLLLNSIQWQLDFEHPSSILLVH